MKFKQSVENRIRGWLPKDPTVLTPRANITANINQAKGTFASKVKCPHCQYRFNYEFIPGISLFSIHLGPYRFFKCPNCRELHNFKITSFGADPSLPTYGDNYSETGIGGKKMALLFGPTLILGIITAILPVLGFTDFTLIISPAIIAVAWPIIYSIYIYTHQNKSHPVQASK